MVDSPAVPPAGERLSRAGVPLPEVDAALRGFQSTRSSQRRDPAAPWARSTASNTSISRRVFWRALPRSAPDAQPAKAPLVPSRPSSRLNAFLAGQPPPSGEFERVRQFLKGGVHRLDLGIHRQVTLGREGQDRPHQQRQGGIVQRLVGSLGQFAPARRRKCRARRSVRSGPRPSHCSNGRFARSGGRRDREPAAEVVLGGGIGIHGAG